MYVDDLIVYLSCSTDEATECVAAIVHSLREFGLYMGLRMNVGKQIILKRTQHAGRHRKVGVGSLK